MRWLTSFKSKNPLIFSTSLDHSLYGWSLMIQAPDQKRALYLIEQDGARQYCRAEKVIASVIANSKRASTFRCSPACSTR
jgi:hypothetical protein